MGSEAEKGAEAAADLSRIAEIRDHPILSSGTTSPGSLDRKNGEGATPLFRKIVEYRERPSEEARGGGCLGPMSLFEFVAAELQKRTDLEDLEARGTVRLALKSSGLTAREVTQEQMIVVIDQVLPRELKVRGVENPEGVCGDLSQAVKGFEAGNDEPTGSSAEDVFRRLSRS